MDLMFCIQDFNNGCITLDYGVEVYLNQYSCHRHHEQNLIEGKLGYVKNKRGKKRLCKWTFHLSIVLFLNVSGGIPLIRVI